MSKFLRADSRMENLRTYYQVQMPSQANSRQNPRAKKYYIYSTNSMFKIPDIVISNFNGIGMDSIDPQLFPSLIEPLNSALYKMIDQKNLYAIQNIKEALSYVKDYKGERIALTERKHSKTVDVIYNNMQIKNLMHLIMEGKPTPFMTAKIKQNLIKAIQQVLPEVKNPEQKNNLEEALVSLGGMPAENINETCKAIFNETQINEKINIIRQKMNYEIEQLRKAQESDLEKLKQSHLLQINQIEKMKLIDPPREVIKEPLEITNLREEELTYKLRGHEKKALETHCRLEVLLNANKDQMQMRWIAHLNSEMSKANACYHEKKKIKIKFYRIRREKIIKSAESEIMLIEKMQKCSLPLLQKQNFPFNKRSTRHYH